jgi:UrcA family protein
MKIADHRKYRAVPVLFGLALASNAALAQPSTPVATVVAPHEVGRWASTGTPVEQFSDIQNVEYGDLNLNKPSDVDELKRRVADAARAGCAELDRLYPPAVYLPAQTNRHCVNNAIVASTSQIDSAVAAASRTAGVVGFTPTRVTSR